jgi:undecaprenyl-phosphate galactose phosphotransferase
MAFSPRPHPNILTDNGHIPQTLPNNETLGIAPTHGMGALLKRLFDVLIVSGLVILLSPLLLLLLLLIARDGGAPLFRHQRIGKDGESFPCLKFRTMVRDAEHRLEEHLLRHPEASAEWAREHKLKNDPRVTPFGRFLRESSLDELPQLFNVLAGHMSLVGPRPVVREELVKYGENVAYYLALRPGLTGAWQASGRNNTTYEERVLMDVWYAKNRTLWLDMKILARTALVVWRRDGAY